MLPVFLKTLPFFLLIGLGYGAAATRFFSREAAVALTQFVFWFALSAMLFNFAATLEFSDIANGDFLLCYLVASAIVYIVATVIAKMRGLTLATSAIEAQCAVIGNVGFLGIPMLVGLFGERAAAPVLMVLSVDLIVFGSLVVAIITGSRGKLGPGLVLTILRGLVTNPMVMSITAGLIWSLYDLPVPVPMAEFLTILGSAATPAALFAIGASLAGKSAERASTALWLSALKLVAHPALVAVFALWVFDLDPFAAAMMIAAAAMPVAGNIYIIAQHYGVSPQRVSTAILFSTVISVLTLTAVLGWVQ
ncbi:AEC family transporter [Roseobacter sp. HKCCA0434]|uniref:AEC family transporter n=1 Tax=Roseobacter sp. HKCCA0434 TaxID=3079297 RepID=UPI002905A8CF|nr:AEC family transporter [Roseobacter sp. HKCCA0434]